MTVVTKLDTEDRKKVAWIASVGKKKLIFKNGAFKFNL